MLQIHKYLNKYQHIYESVTEVVIEIYTTPMSGQIFVRGFNNSQKIMAEKYN